MILWQHKEAELCSHPPHNAGAVNIAAVKKRQYVDVWDFASALFCFYLRFTYAERPREALPSKRGDILEVSVISKRALINEEIKAEEVRVVDSEGKQLGILKIGDALRAASEADLDLVEIAPEAKPPVCKIMDYGKFRFEQAKKEKEARKNQHVIEVKEGSRSAACFKRLMAEDAPVVNVPQWLERDKNALKGTVAKLPAREDIDMPIEEHLIVELYSK